MCHSPPSDQSDLHAHSLAGKSLFINAGHIFLLFAAVIHLRFPKKERNGRGNR